MCVSEFIEIFFLFFVFFFNFPFHWLFTADHHYLVAVHCAALPFFFPIFIYFDLNCLQSKIQSTIIRRQLSNSNYNYLAIRAVPLFPNQNHHIRSPPLANTFGIPTTKCHYHYSFSSTVSLWWLLSRLESSAVTLSLETVKDAQCLIGTANCRWCSHCYCYCHSLRLLSACGGVCNVNGHIITTTTTI